MTRFNPYLSGLGDINLDVLARMLYQSESAVETTEIEWKREWEFDSRPMCANMARHLIAFANRDPDDAARLFSGHAFLVIGVEPGAWGNAPVLDPADLTQKLEPFTGLELSWHPVYVNVDGHRVLVLVVDPPQWGDPIYSMMRSSREAESGKEIEAGTVYVRKPGMTVPASQVDIDRLNTRATTPAPRLDVKADWNLGASGDYVGVIVGNHPNGREAFLREVGFTIAGTSPLTVAKSNADIPELPEDSAFFVSLPIMRTDTPIGPGEILQFPVELGRLPFFWDAETQLFPYVYFDDGKWLVGDPRNLVAELERFGWREDLNAPPMFGVLSMTGAWPKVIHNLRVDLDLSGPDSRSLP